MWIIALIEIQQDILRCFTSLFEWGVGRHAVDSTWSDLSEFQVARLVARHCVNYTAVLMAIVE